MWSQFPRIAVVSVASLALTACGGGGGGSHEQPSVPTSITIVSGNGQSGLVGTELPAALTVRVTDSGSRPLSGVTVSWAVTAGGGIVTPTTSTTDSSGTTSTRWTLGTALGVNRATAAVAGTSVVVFEATATAAVTASVTVASPTLSPYEGDTMQLTAVAKDAYGNVLPGKTVGWSSSKPELAPVSSTGLLQTWGTGPVDVTASVDGVKGSVTLTLTPILVNVSVGAKEVVMDGTTERCEELDVADGPARFVRADDGSLRQVHARLQPAGARVGRPAHCGLLRELGMGVVRVSRRQLVAGARAQRVPRCDRGHMPAGQSVLVQLDHVFGVDGRRADIHEAVSPGPRCCTGAQRLGATVQHTPSWSTCR